MTTGFDVDKVYAALKDRLGWQQPTVQNDFTLTSAVTTCSSGRYLNMIHPACSANNLYYLQEDPAISSAEFITWLTDFRKGKILDAVTSVLNSPTTVDEAAMDFERGYNTQFTAVTNNGKFVGRKIKVADGDFMAQLHSVAFMFDGAVTFNLYLFHDLKKEPLWGQSVTTVANDLTIVSLTDKVVRPNNTTTKGGTYYLGYIQDDLGDVHALDVAGCWKGFRAVGSMGVEMNPGETSETINTYGYSTTTNTYGMMVELSSGKDYTNTIVKRAYEFDTLIGYKMAAACIELSVGTVRQNYIQRVTEQAVTEWNMELNRTYDKETSMSGGIYSKMKAEVKRLQASFNCENKSITITTPQC